jgi:hypothetical protein
MSLGSSERPVRTADNRAAICEPTVTISYNPIGLYGILPLKYIIPPPSMFHGHSQLLFWSTQASSQT